MLRKLFEPTTTGSAATTETASRRPAVRAVPKPRELRLTAETAGVEVKELEDWVTFEAAGEILGLSRGGVAYAVFHNNEFNIATDVRTVTVKKIYLLRTRAVHEHKKRRDAEIRLAEQARRGH